MKHDIYAEFWNPQRKGADFYKIDRKVIDIYQKIKLASLHMTTKQNEDWARKKKYEPWIREYLRKIEIKKNTLKKLIDIDESKSGEIPYLFIKIHFKLRKPYLSRDDEYFYIMDNPIVKEKVFKIPYIRSTTWKGELRRVVKDITPEFEVRLFGNKKESEESKQGRLFFYPTFLNGINKSDSLDVITPLNRINKSPVRGPILFEVIPEGYRGEFKLIYLPFDIINDESRLKKEIKEDLEVLKEAIQKMMLEYGFSAKKTSGYGVIEEELIEVRVNKQVKSNVFFDEFKNMIDLEIKRMISDERSSTA